MSRIADHGILYGCGGCGGRMMGLRPFENLLEDGLGARVWIASEAEGVGGAGRAGGAGGACPFCARAMQAPTADAGAPDGLAVCHVCHQVWMPASADDWIRAHAAPGVSALPQAAPLPSVCSNCGAPLQPDEDGRCRFCHTQVAAPAPIVVNVESTPTAGDRFLDALSGLLTKPV